MNRIKYCRKIMDLTFVQCLAITIKNKIVAIVVDTLKVTQQYPPASLATFDDT